MAVQPVRLVIEPIEEPCDCKGGPCGWKHFRPGPVRDMAVFDALAAECPRHESVEKHENGDYVHVLLGANPACSGAYLAAQMVRDGHWSYARGQMDAYAQRAEFRRAAWHGVPMPRGTCTRCDRTASCSCGGTCLLCHDCPDCTVQALDSRAS